MRCYLPHLNEIKNSTIVSQLKALVKEHQLDVVLGAMSVSQGVFLLLFSHRLNKEILLVVNDAKDLHKTLADAKNIMEEVYAS